MKVLFPILIIVLSFMACDNGNNVVSPNDVPVVQSASSYDVIKEEGITYADGLSHESVNSSNSTTFPLKLFQRVHTGVFQEHLL